MLNYILAYIIYFIAPCCYIELYDRHCIRKQNDVERLKRTLDWKREEEIKRVGFLMKLRGEI